MDESITKAQLREIVKRVAKENGLCYKELLDLFEKYLPTKEVDNIYPNAVEDTLFHIIQQYLNEHCS